MSEQVKRKPARISSRNTGLRMFGILNAQGDFWSPQPFHTRGDAKAYIRRFWGSQLDMFERCLRTHKVVPVRVHLIQLREGERE